MLRSAFPNYRCRLKSWWTKQLHGQILTVGARQNAKLLSFFIVFQADGAGIVVVA